MRLAEEFATLCALALTFRRTQLKHELLVGELQHRMRNMFSTIGAVVYSTLKAHPEPAIFRKVFDGRLLAFSRAHSLALETGTPDLRSLLVDTLAPYSIDHEVTIEGPQLILSQEAAVAFSLAAHELATNAAKYGALSRDGGCVRISWMLANDDAPSFELNWNQTGGPEVQSPERKGYGQKTLKRSLSAAFDGAIDLTYDPGGLMCRVKAPYTPRLGTRAM
ncbi:sensor histidine kinase [Sphingomonas rhizophila]|uniref:histidine kinase n=1 Tax=Sphingomonas rhizophila TaxID=2071607 RepID=A0A7G9S8K1_9SPHN|nr:sensor histidine kinase [Sphingomonas rhizophila]QNN64176.1 sensor histidine kinase [Sphingomonas rhizophila]